MANESGTDRLTGFNHIGPQVVAMAKVHMIGGLQGVDIIGMAHLKHGGLEPRVWGGADVRQGFDLGAG